MRWSARIFLTVYSLHRYIDIMYLLVCAYCSTKQQQQQQQIQQVRKYSKNRESPPTSVRRIVDSGVGVFRNLSQASFDPSN